MKMRTSLLVFVVAMLITLLCFRTCSAFAAPSNGFDLTNSTVAIEQILQGGPAKDGIPSIDQPAFKPAKKVTWLNDDQQVLSLTFNGVTKAYPLAILNWHEIVNDKIDDQAVVISYCPLCGTGVGFSSMVANKQLMFGVSGLLYNSDVLLYDRETESLWSQLKSRAISGPLQGETLKMLPLQQMTWQAWKSTYPDGLVLSRDTGFLRNYAESPYGRYDESPVLYFPVEFLSQAYHPKERVLGVEINGKFKAYPFVELAKHGGGQVVDQFNGVTLSVQFDALSRTGRVTQLAGESARPSQDQNVMLPAVNAFWFAWFTFHPDTAVFKSP